MNSPETGEFPKQKASNAENVSIWWRHHVGGMVLTLLGLSVLLYHILCIFNHGGIKCSELLCSCVPSFSVCPWLHYFIRIPDQCRIKAFFLFNLHAAIIATSKYGSVYIAPRGAHDAITVTTQYACWCLKLPTSWLFTQPFAQDQVKANTKAPRHWRFWGEFTGDRWIPRTKGQ